MSPRNSSRGGANTNADALSKKSNSPNHSSQLQNEVKASSSTPARPSDGSSGNATPATSVSKGHNTMPPPSKPLLEGGSKGGMTSIREEGVTGPG